SIDGARWSVHGVRTRRRRDDGRGRHRGEPAHGRNAERTHRPEDGQDRKKAVATEREAFERATPAGALVLCVWNAIQRVGPSRVMRTACPTRYSTWMRSPGSRLPITASGPMRALCTWPPGSSTSVKKTSHDTWPWTLIGWMLRRMPSRVPLSKLAPAENPFERKEERLRGVERRQQSGAIVVDEALEESRRQLPGVLRQQRAFHPVDHRVARLQNMTIDDQAHDWIVEAGVVEERCVRAGREPGFRLPPSAERCGIRLA